MANPTDANTPPSMTFYISPAGFACALACIVTVLGAAHVATSILRYEFGHDYQWGFVRQFNLDEEMNLPSWYSASALLVASLLLVMIGMVKYGLRDLYARHWLVLAAIFLYLSADEAAGLHEMSEAFTKQLHFSGFFYYPWVVGGALVVLIIGLSYWRFLFHLPRRTKTLVIVAGLLYVGGALGVESICARLDEQYGFKNMTYSIVAGIEELCEMAGIIIFVYALMRYAATMADTIAFSFHDISTDQLQLRKEETLRSKGNDPVRAA